MVELSAFDDRVLGLPSRLGLEERLPPPLLALELETILAFTAGAALFTGVNYWPAYAFPLTLFGLVVGALSAESPRGAGARLLVHFGYLELASLVLDVLWLLTPKAVVAPAEGAETPKVEIVQTSFLATFAVGLTMLLKLLVLLKVGQRLQEAGLLGVPPGGGSGLPVPGGVPGAFPRGRSSAGYEAFLPPEDAPLYRDGPSSYEYNPDEEDHAAPNHTVFDSEAPPSAATDRDATPVKLPSP